MIKRLSLAILLILPLPALAQVALGDHDLFETRFGTLNVIEDDLGLDRLFWNGVQVGEDAAPQMSIRAAYGLPDEAFDYVLLTMNFGGSGCPPPLQVLRVSAQGVTLGPVVGDCVAPPELDVRLMPGQIEIDTPHRDLGIERSIFVWDGTSLTEHEVMAGPATPSRADPRQWIGQHPYRIFEDSSERARFEEIMRDWQLEELATRIGPTNTVVEQNGWVQGGRMHGPQLRHPARCLGYSHRRRGTGGCDDGCRSGPKPIRARGG